MTFDGLISGDYQSGITLLGSERCINLYMQSITADGGNPAQRAALLRVPGYSLLAQLPDAPGRGAYAVNGRFFCVAGSTLFEFLSTTSFVARGSVAPGSGPALMDCNSVQVGILASGAVYMYNLGTNAFQRVASGLPAVVDSMCTLDTYFIFLAANSQQFTISAPLDGTTVSALDFGSPETPDNAVAVAENHLLLWIFCEDEIVPFQDTGALSFPFQRVAGAQIEIGLAAGASIAKLDNTLFWLGSSPRGGPQIFRADGFLPTRVSNHAIEEAMESYGAISDAVGSALEESGHLYYRLDFPTDNVTWLYDVATKKFHQRAWWNTALGTYSADAARYHAWCFNAHMALDYTSGNVYAVSPSFATHNGNPIRWLRSSPFIADGRKEMFYDGLELFMATGQAAAGVDPKVNLRYSDDGGVTWSNSRARSSGRTGKTDKRVRWLRLGRGRTRVFEISSSDAAASVAILGAEIYARTGSS